MRNPIENLGDYNKVREDLQAVGGSLEALYKSVGDTAVLKATPKLLLKGGVFGVSIVGIAYFGYQGICFMKDRKKKIENEPVLKKKFFKSFETKSAIKDNDEFTDCDEINGKA